MQRTEHLKDPSRFKSKRYYTGKPCRHGHIAERRLCDGKCVECQRQRQLEIGGGAWPKAKPENARRWRQSPKRKESLRRYRLSAKGRAQEARYRKSEKRKAVVRRYKYTDQGKDALKRHKRSEKHKAATKRYQMTDKYVAQVKKYRQSERGRANAIRYVIARKARKLNQTVVPYSYEDRIERFRQFENECAYCGSAGKLTEDHVVPLANGGIHGISNIVPCCSTCNKRKQHKNVEDWYRGQEFFSESRWQKIKEVLLWTLA